MATAETIINVSLVRRNVSGDTALLRELVAIFREELPVMNSALLVAFALGDAVAIKAAAHRLKGSLSALGAICWSTVDQLEDCAQNGALGRARTLFDELQSELREVAPALEEVIARGAS
jgi:HPt (histidine-containing phosphotransfer) domain-containing protein